MGIRVPRVTLSADYDDDSAFGDLNLAAVGYGLHQAWVYATMFNASAIFGIPAQTLNIYGNHVSGAFLVSVIFFAATLLGAAATDQKFINAYTSRRIIMAACLSMAVGTAMLIPDLDAFGGLAAAVETTSGILTGCGSALMIVSWGVVFARCDTASIALNTAVAIIVGFAVYATMLCELSYPFGAIITAALPLVAGALCALKTPTPFSKRGTVPIFKPLPIKKKKFVAIFGPPVFVFGIALGLIRQTYIQTILPSASGPYGSLLLFAAACATLLLVLTVSALSRQGRWSRLFRSFVPLLAVTVFFVPTATSTDSPISGLILLIGFLCFEALMWIFFGDMAQRYRISPVFVFGLGRGLLGLAMVADVWLPFIVRQWAESIPNGETMIPLFLLALMLIAYTLLPDERDLAPAINPCPALHFKGIDGELKEIKAAGMPAQQDAHTGRAGTAKDAASAGADIAGQAGAQNTADAGTGTKTAVQEPAAVAGNETNAQKQDASPKAQDEQAPQQAAANQAPVDAAGADAAKAAPQSPEEESGVRRGRFHRKCEAVANTFLLSRRETEVLFFLAKGHNSSYIQEKLYISEGTAKTHIRHIYRKLDVHTQQELMRLVESLEVEDVDFS